VNKIVVTTAGASTSTDHRADNTATVRHIIRVTVALDAGIRQKTADLRRTC
jgi:hypothetical protein